MESARRVVRDFASVLDFIEGLPPPKDGLERVFRGQSGDHGTLRPRALRSAITNSTQWRATARALSEELAQNTPELLYDGQRVAAATSAEALVQHYGAGSHYLDVSRSVAIALWFALHKAVQKEFTSKIMTDPGGPDMRSLALMIEYGRNRDPGVLYVFDVPDWAGGPRGHGKLFDLVDVGRFGLVSARARRQQGCVIYGEGDLSDCLAAPPLVVDWPMKGAPDTVRQPARNLFPPPSKDPFYAALLRIPLVPCLREQSNNEWIRVEHPLGVDQYLTNRQVIDEFDECLGTLRRPLVLPEILRLVSGQPVENLCGHSIGDALPILFEAPMVWIRQTELWNEPVLCDSLADETRLVTARGNRSRRTTDLTNVFVEFSPLDFTKWFEFEDPAEDIDIPRGLWLAREGGDIRFFVFVERYREQHIPPLVPFGPFRVSHGNDSSILLTDSSGNVVGSEASALLSRQLFPALALLRDLDPRNKECSYRTVTLLDGSTRFCIYTFNVDQLAQLTQAGAEYQGVRYVFPRDLGTEYPYTGFL
jgi:hypothetical protein